MISSLFEIDPVAFQFGFVSVRWYSLGYLVTILVILIHLKKYTDLSWSQLENSASITVISCIICSRMFYVLFYNLSAYLHHPSEILQIWCGGLSFHGGLTGVVIGVYLSQKIHKQSVISVLDHISCVVPFGIFLVRITNLINGELMGRPSEFGIVFPDGIRRHPSQIYEAVFEGLVILIVLNILRYKYKLDKQPGVLSMIFIGMYAVARITCELFRMPDPQIGFIMKYFSMGQILSVIMLILSVKAFLYIRTKYNAKSV
ncbi:MAG: prolipoprotein diacylglyceryl transferase [Candidatus Xenolissoclinum pacificiensis L6]|uniref:Phosphatidylglycerol--prolipoprotein diacylglyceryl transferase n=1 Tax=Candidatus Xenolissoclinum pacificiensis L6 TaxID=1401685 RepID=W2V001_9RICK|nr:MAG: prolipoprotein diacylglyceryl transferase [Candidatus Xenolissoclinum pacificiensis L6]